MTKKHFDIFYFQNLSRLGIKKTESENTDSVFY